MIMYYMLSGILSESGEGEISIKSIPDKFF